jgi:hypothetical protein
MIIAMSGAPQHGGVSGEDQKHGHAQRQVDQIEHGISPRLDRRSRCVLGKTVSAPFGTALRDINDS